MVSRRILNLPSFIQAILPKITPINSTQLQPTLKLFHKASQQHVSGSLFLARGVVHSLNGASFSPPSWFLLPPQLGATCSLMSSIAVFTVKQTSDLTFCSLWAFAEKQIWQEKSGWFILGRLATIWAWASSRSGTRVETQWNGVADNGREWSTCSSSRSGYRDGRIWEFGRKIRILDGLPLE